MTDSNVPDRQTRSGCAQEQLDMLLRCSNTKDMSEWNAWREANPDEDIYLEGADLRGAQLRGAYLGEGLLYSKTETDISLTGKVHLEGAILVGAQLQGAILAKAELERAQLMYAQLEGVVFFETHLEGASLAEAGLQGTRFWLAHLEGASLFGAQVDHSTSILDCSFDRRTSFERVDLAPCDCDPAFRTAITHNLRQLRWERWYGKWPHWIYRWPVWLFWQMSDYGRSVARIGLWFVILSIVFGSIYFMAAVHAPPGIINNFIADDNGCVPSPAMGMLRAAYFSIVTMTTLGFGDMHARIDSGWGHGLLILQVITGYFLLGVLISRVTIAFQTVGPAQPLAKPRGWWRRWRGKIVLVCVALILLAFGCGLYDWAVSRWPEVQRKAQELRRQRP